MDEAGDPVLEDEYAAFDDDQQPYLSPGEKSLLLRYRMSRRHVPDAAEGTLSPLSSSAGTGTGTRYNSEHNPEPSTPPLLLSSPSAASLASSHGALSAAAEAMLMTPAKGPVGLRNGIREGLRDGLLQSALPHDASSPRFPPSPDRVALARRLGQLAQQLTMGVEVDELTLAAQLVQLERVVVATHSSSPAQPSPLDHTPARVPAKMTPYYHTPARIPESPASPARAPPTNHYSPAPRARPHPFSSPAHLHLQQQHRPVRFSHPARSHSDVAGMVPRSPFSSPAVAVGPSQPPSLHRSRYSDLSASMLARLSEINAASLLREGEPNTAPTPEVEPEPESEPEPEPEPPKKGGMTAQQADKVIAEAAKLNKELSIVVDNLKARLEESDHIHSLLIERAERAAQRIIFLQNRISYLEEELQENDEELQHLRICLKAVEIQLPPHPDLEIQRCISTFKEDFRALKQKRVNRSSVTSFNTSFDNSGS